MAAREELGWTIDELGQRVRAALAEGYRAPRNGQVSPLPSLRTIRYYTTLGLLAPPSATRGRRAYYGEIHLRQLVAIKRMQAEGLSLVEVQQRLASATTRELAELARLPAAARPPGAADRGGDDRRGGSRRGAERFWTAAPRGEGRGGTTPPPGGRRLALGVPIGAGATLLLHEPRRQPDEDDLRALGRAATALLAELKRRGLTGSALAGDEPRGRR